MNRRGRIRQTTGFTIVELLIVIIVIAILAAIVIATYQGITQSTDNSRIEAAARTYQKALSDYAIDHNDTWPTGGDACLGNGYPNNQCWNGPNGTWSVDATVDAALAPYINGEKPTPATHVLQITTAPDYRLGLLFISSQNKLVYYLEGAGQTCLNGSPGTTEMQGTQCVIVLNAP